MESIPKILNVFPEQNQLIRVRFVNGVEKIYDCKPLIERFHFQRLCNEAFFRQVHVDAGGYGVSWDADIDMSEYELWTNGTTVNAQNAISSS